MPQTILALHLGMVTGACALAVYREEPPWTIVFVGLLAGLAFWTLFEYALHRWLLHHTRRPWIRRMFWEAAHKEHHSYLAMKDPDHHGVHAAITVPIAALALALCAGISAGGFALAAGAGWLVGYCLYEALHWLFHGLEPESGLWRVRPLRRLYDAHAIHHLEQANRNYGFVTRFWDRRFGTLYEAPPA